MHECLTGALVDVKKLTASRAHLLNDNALCCNYDYNVLQQLNEQLIDYINNNIDTESSGQILQNNDSYLDSTACKQFANTVLQHSYSPLAYITCSHMLDFDQVITSLKRKTAFSHHVNAAKLKTIFFSHQNKDVDKVIADYPQFNNLYCFYLQNHRDVLKYERYIIANSNKRTTLQTCYECKHYNIDDITTVEYIDLSDSDDNPLCCDDNSTQTNAIEKRDTDATSLNTLSGTKRRVADVTATNKQAKQGQHRSSNNVQFLCSKLCDICKLKRHSTARFKHYNKNYRIILEYNRNLIRRNERRANYVTMRPIVIANAYLSSSKLHVRVKIFQKLLKVQSRSLSNYFADLTRAKHNNTVLSWAQNCRHLKYFERRYSLFSLYDLSICMDETGWYEVTAEQVAVSLALTLRHELANKNMFYKQSDGTYYNSPKSILSVASGIGGDLIHFVKLFNCKATCIDTVEKLKLLRHNAHIYGVANKMQMFGGYCNDFLTRFPNCVESLKDPSSGLLYGKYDIVISSPPWGGVNYRQLNQWKLSQDNNCLDIIRFSIKASTVCLFLMPSILDIIDFVQVIDDLRVIYNLYINVSVIYTGLSMKTPNMLIVTVSRHKPLFLNHFSKQYNCQVCCMNKVKSVFYKFSMAPVKGIERTLESSLVKLLNEETYLNKPFKFLLPKVLPMNKLIEIITALYNCQELFDAIKITHGKLKDLKLKLGPLFFHIWKLLDQESYKSFRKARAVIKEQLNNK